MSKRPSQKELYSRNILYDKQERREHRRSASQKLLHSLQSRPSFAELVDRGILMSENEQFHEKIMQIVSLVNSSPNVMTTTKTQIGQICENVKQDYSSMVSRLNGQIFETKQTLNQYEDDVQSRDQRLRQELENKQRQLIHDDGIIDQQHRELELIQNQHQQEIKKLKIAHQEKLEKHKLLFNNNNKNGNNNRIKQSLQYLRGVSDALHSQIMQYSSNDRHKLQQLQQQKSQINNVIDEVYELSFAAANSGGSNNMDDIKDQELINEYENKLEKQNQQIMKLKQQKKEMVKLVNEKMRDLKYVHQQELQKERQIANVLVENHRKHVETIKQRANRPQSVNNSQQFIEMQQRMEQLKKMYNQALMENDSLKKSKKKLEKIVVKLSTDIVQTVNKS